MMRCENRARWGIRALGATCALLGLAGWPGPAAAQEGAAQGTQGPAPLAAPFAAEAALPPAPSIPTFAPGPVVVELYTSQGCSSCPPADAFMEELSKRDDVLALALHVDYWDYIGWADVFASPAHTERQKSYARAARAKTIYTPQMIVAGRERIEGFRPMQVADLIQDYGLRPSAVEITLERAGEMVRIAARAEPPLKNAVLVQLVRYLPEETVRIERGENAGRTVTYHNIVTSWETVAEWSGRAELTLEARAEGGQPVAVILQNPGPGPIVAAAALR